MISMLFEQVMLAIKKHLKYKCTESYNYKIKASVGGKLGGINRKSSISTIPSSPALVILGALSLKIAGLPFLSPLN